MYFEYSDQVVGYQKMSCGAVPNDTLGCPRDNTYLINKTLEDNILNRMRSFTFPDYVFFRKGYPFRINDHRKPKRRISVVVAGFYDYHLYGVPGTVV